ncbi:YveK family protein [Ornithinibacillus halotolerans]|uniref:Capsular polysaccharide biosynthesis protein n=1 Tax=Ornithinibacillus halotolerans TaxID=1274357 RepID=A0A916RQK9_9BACI|nr:Wzz/FepE/Etk N-terminal domain-containing protein [Ornithinibacillus halotolerans]GGA65051.1 capsular polysaccharide biosynthesis protein [Ornithinibacillus halotolerans]
MEETISLKEIFEVIKKRMKLIISLVVIAAIISAIISFFVLTPNYQSGTQFIVNQQNTDPNAQYSVNDVRLNVELINTYSEIIRSPRILDAVIKELNLDLTVGALKEKINVASPDSSQVVNVTVTDPDPELATKIANTTVAVFQKEVPVLMNVDNVQVLSPAVTPANPSPVSPNKQLNIAIAIVLGAMVGVGLAFLLEYLDNTLKSEEDILKRLNVPVLGTISHMDESDVIRQGQANQAVATRRQKGV